MLPNSEEKRYEINLPPAPLVPRENFGLRVRGRLRAALKSFGSLTVPEATDERYPKVELTYWRPVTGVNFGDEIARAVVTLMLALRGMTLEDQASGSPQLLAVGSVLQMAREGATVWGSGLNGAVSEADHKYRSLHVCAVRGPITRQFLQRRGVEVPEIYGDPALLIPLITKGRFQHRPLYKRIGLVPNLFDMAAAQLACERNPGLVLIDPRRSWEVVVSEIVRCSMILASSLHGLILAESFAIPARFVPLSNHEPRLKYQDYYNGTGRDFEPAKSIEHALQIGGQFALNFEPQKLIDAFPYKLWDVV